MTAEQRNEFIDILLLMAERTTTLSVRFETLRALLEERGVFSATEFEQKNAEFRAHWNLQGHPHVALSGNLATDEYFARMRLLLDSPKDAK